MLYWIIDVSGTFNTIIDINEMKIKINQGTSS